ncbi:MAG: sulfatase-like hydrolase/transferase [Planctomycetes bacterium]|nr:sulfatase-like hydrolase/transferase [Planctomycetota bacterium]
MPLRHVVTLVSLLVAAEHTWAQDARPNVVLVMADDQGYGDVGYMGHATLKTPNLDRAAAAGLRFERFYASAPVCSPTRASVLTGRTPNRSGVFQWGHPLRTQETTLAEVLRGAGYATGHFGKWHLGAVCRRSPVHPGHHGFDTWWSAPNFYDSDPILSHEGEAVQLQGESSEVTVACALPWIREQVAAERPFLAVIWFGSPHDPHRASDENRALYQDADEAHREYWGEITGIDRAFGTLRAELEALGVRENTLLWYTSDNGGRARVSDLKARRGQKGQIYEGGLMVPAFVEWPRLLSTSHSVTRSVTTRCSTSDIFPTVVAALGIELAEDHPPLDGESLLPLLMGQSFERTKALAFWNHDVKGIGVPSHQIMQEMLRLQQRGEDQEPDDPSRYADVLPSNRSFLSRFSGPSAWIDGDFKLHRIPKSRGEPNYELYDLSNDPGETHDLAAMEPERVEAMKQALERWMASVVASYEGKDYE